MKCGLLLTRNEDSDLSCTWITPDWLGTWLDLIRWICSRIPNTCSRRQVEGASSHCCLLPRNQTLDSLTDLAICCLEREKTNTLILHPASPREEPEPMHIGHAQPTAAENLQCRGRGVCFYCGEATHLIAQCPTSPQMWEALLRGKCMVDEPHANVVSHQLSSPI